MIKKWYFGWTVLLGVFLNYMAIVGIMVYTLPLFYPSIIHEYGFSTEQVTRPAFLSYMAGAFLTPFISPFYDRYSIRKFMMAGTVFMVLGLLALGKFQTFTQMIAIYLVFAFGQVCSGQVPTMVVITRWFNRHRGLAVGIVLTSTSVGGAVFPLVVRQVMARANWREAIFVLMAVGAVMMVLPLIFFIRNRPEDIGLRQAQADPLMSLRADGQPTDGPTLKEASHQLEFYLLAFVTGTLWFSLNGIVQHQTIFIGNELGIGIENLTLISSAFFTSAIVGKLALGWLADRFSKTLIMFCSVLNLIIGLFVLRLSGGGNLAVLYAYAVIYGIGYGGMFTMIQLVIADFYAGKHYGRILGMLTMVDIAAGGLGIPAVGIMQGAFGTYMPVLEILMGLYAVTGITVLVLHRLRRRTVAAAVEPALTI
jgi:MFS transporter, OFA family, oxalate/formate antiporter